MNNMKNKSRVSKVFKVSNGQGFQEFIKGCQGSQGFQSLVSRLSRFQNWVLWVKEPLSEVSSAQPNPQMSASPTKTEPFHPLCVSVYEVTGVEGGHVSGRGGGTWSAGSPSAGQSPRHQQRGPHTPCPGTPPPPLLSTGPTTSPTPAAAKKVLVYISSTGQLSSVCLSNTWRNQDCAHCNPI